VKPFLRGKKVDSRKDLGGKGGVDTHGMKRGDFKTVPKKKGGGGSKWPVTCRDGHPNVKEIACLKEWKEGKNIPWKTTASRPWGLGRRPGGGGKR